MTDLLPRVAKAMSRLICSVIGHKRVDGVLKRSPHTSYTHWRDVTCARCGAEIAWKVEYHDD